MLDGMDALRSEVPDKKAILLCRKTVHIAGVVTFFGPFLFPKYCDDDEKRGKIRSFRAWSFRVFVEAMCLHIDAMPMPTLLNLLAKTES